MGQYGAAVDASGAKTTPETVQKIIAAQYTNSADNPVIGGGVITGLGTLAFQVSAGVAVCTTAAGAVMVAWDATQTALITPPSSGTTYWVVYVDVNGNVLVNTLPVVAPYVTLGKFSVPAGTTATSSLTNTWNTNYALPYGASLHTLFDGTDKSNNAMGGTINVVTGSFYVPTDRRVCIELTTSLMAVQAHTGNPVATGSAYQKIILDGVLIRSMERQLTGNAESTEQYREYVNVQKGTHTVMLSLDDGVTGYKRFYADGGWPGQRLTVLDEGVSQ